MADDCWGILYRHICVQTEPTSDGDHSDVDSIHSGDLCESKQHDISTNEKQFNKNICNKKRNTHFHKIVHDTRNQKSLFYGMTDDLLLI